MWSRQIGDWSTICAIMAKPTLQFYADWKSLLFLALFLPLLLSLGFWQIHRGEEKQRLTEQYQQQSSRQPVALDLLKPESSLAFLPVSFTGEITDKHYFLLDNQMRQGKVGFDVLTPVETEKQIVILNLGWIAANSNRTKLPSIVLPNGKKQIEGIIYKPEKAAYVLRDEKLPQDWPKIIQVVDMKKISALYKEKKVFPFVVRADTFLPFAFNTNWPTVNLNPEKHFGYAFQWFLMAFALVVLFFALNSNIFHGLTSDKE